MISNPSEYNSAQDQTTNTVNIQPIILHRQWLTFINNLKLHHDNNSQIIDDEYDVIVEHGQEEFDPKHLLSRDWLTSCFLSGSSFCVVYFDLSAVERCLWNPVFVLDVNPTWKVIFLIYHN